MNFVWWKAVAAFALVPLAFGRPRRLLERGLGGRSRGAIVAVFAISRLAAALAAFVVLDLPLPADASGYYSAFARAVLEGGRHELSPYSPGFDYLIGALLAVSGSALSFVLLMIAAETGAFALLLALADRHRAGVARSLATLWLVSPVSVIHVALGGQDEALILLAWTIVAALVLGGRAAAAGVAVAMGLGATKLLGLFAALPLVGQPGGRASRAAVAALAACAGLALLLAVLGIPAGNVAREAHLVTSGNVWAVASIAAGRAGAAPLPGVLMLTAIVLAAAGAYLHLRPWTPPLDQLLRVSGTVACLFLLFSQKSFANYLVIFLPGVLYLALRAPAGERAFVLGVMLPVSAFEPSLWFQLREGEALAGSWPSRMGILAADLALVAGYALLARRGFSGSIGAFEAPQSGAA